MTSKPTILRGRSPGRSQTFCAGDRSLAEEKTMKRLSVATAGDFAMLLADVQGLRRFDSAEETAQAFVGILYEYFRESLILLRLFTTVRYAGLGELDRQFVDRRATDTGTANLITGNTPVFTLLGTRGRNPDWNERRKSQHFRCIPLASTAYVASLPMLSMQFKSVGFDLGRIDDWDAAVAAEGRADEYSGMLYIRDAGVEKDEQGRMIVPKQDFVAANNVRTVLGFGSGYATHPTLVTLFAFTNETIERSEAEPLASLLDAYLESSAELVRQGRVFKSGQQ
jgi:hypothetical protein